MHTGPLDGVLTYCRRLVGAPSGDDSTDGRLLERFARQGDQRAFETLLERHGALVLGVCRRVLRDANDVEDAFQATFLVLVRKAHSLDGRASLAGWLHVVASHIALKIKNRASRRRERQQPPEEAPTATDHTEEAAWRDLRPVLDEELARLPAKYREPLVLCYLQGKTNEEAAALLGWTRGTVSGRLARARDTLRDRLMRRGIDLSALPLAAPAFEVVPAALRQTVARAASGAEASASPTATAMADDAIRHLSLARGRRGALLVLACCVLGATAAATVALSRSGGVEPAVEQPKTTRHVLRPVSSPTVVVRAQYPGADARTLAATVAEPLEKQMAGIDGMVSLFSESSAEGGYELTVSFRTGTDLRQARVLVQERANLAIPELPDLVKVCGVRTGEKPGAPLQFVTVAPDDPGVPLSRAVGEAERMRETLARVPGVGEVTITGPEAAAVRLFLDPEKMAKAGVALADVQQALREANVQVAAGQITFLVEKPPPLDELRSLVVRTDGKGKIVRLKDVAEVELVPGREDGVLSNGKPVVLLSVSPTHGADEGALGAMLRELIREQELPKGIRATVVFDLTPKPDVPGRERFLRLDVALPESASAARTATVLRKCEDILRDAVGVVDVLALVGTPALPSANQGRALARLRPDGPAEWDKAVKAIRTRLTDEIPDVVVTLSEEAWASAGPLDGCPVAFAIQDRDNRGGLPAVADHFVERLTKTGRLTDVSADRATREVPRLDIEVDRSNVKAMGVRLEDVYATLQVIKPDARSGTRAEDVRRLKIRNARGEMVPFGALAKVEDVMAPVVVQRSDGHPAVAISANIGEGVSAAQTRALIEEMARKELPEGYRLTWLREPPTR